MADDVALLSAIVRVAAAVAWLVVVLLVLRAERARRVAGLMLALMLAAIAFGGLVPVLGITLPAGTLSWLYTGASFLALVIAVVWLLAARSTRRREARIAGYQRDYDLAYPEERIIAEYHRADE